MAEKLLRFKGISISKEDFEMKYNFQLTDIEWSILVQNAANSWDEGADELRLLVFKHIRQGLAKIGFKPVLDGKEIKFAKTIDGNQKASE